MSISCSRVTSDNMTLVVGLITGLLAGLFIIALCHSVAAVCRKQTEERRTTMVDAGCGRLGSPFEYVEVNGGTSHD